MLRKKHNATTAHSTHVKWAQVCSSVVADVHTRALCVRALEIWVVFGKLHPVPPQIRIHHFLVLCCRCQGAGAAGAW